MSRLIEVTRTAQGYEMVPMFGYHQGKVVAIAEQLTMSEVEFRGNKVVGIITAAWGLMLRSENLDLLTVKALGVGSVFRRSPSSFATRVIAGHYTDNSNRRLFRASFVTANPHGVFYSP